MSNFRELKKSAIDPSRKRMNYPKFGIQMKRTKLNIRITEQEKMKLKDLAKEQGITLSKLVLQSVRMSKS